MGSVDRLFLFETRYYSYDFANYVYWTTPALHLLISNYNYFSVHVLIINDHIWVLIRSQRPVPTISFQISDTCTLRGGVSEVAPKRFSQKMDFLCVHLMPHGCDLINFSNSLLSLFALHLSLSGWPCHADLPLLGLRVD